MRRNLFVMLSLVLCAATAVAAEGWKESGLHEGGTTYVITSRAGECKVVIAPGMTTLKLTSWLADQEVTDIAVVAGNEVELTGTVKERGRVVARKPSMAALRTACGSRLGSLPRGAAQAEAALKRAEHASQPAK